MMSDEAAVAMIDALNALAVDYMIVGSVSSAFYGSPTAGLGVDFVARLTQSQVSALAERLSPRLTLEHPEESGTALRYLFRSADAGAYVELYRLSDDPYDEERFARRVRVKLFGRDTFLPTAEDVVVTKLLWYGEGPRAKHFEDARNVVLVQRDALDWDYVQRLCDRHGTRELLDKIRRSIPQVD